MSNIEDDVKILEGKKQCMEGGWEIETYYAKGNVRRNRTVYFRTKRN